MSVSKDELVLYTNPQSRGGTARWMLEEIGAPYRAEILDYGDGMKSPAYLAINPMGKVPAVTHRGMVVTEVSAICAYLADAFPDAGLAPPPGSPQRAPYYRWMFFVAGPLEAASTNAAFGFEVPPERERSVGYGSFARTLDAIESAVAGKRFVAGDSFTAADLYIADYLNIFMKFGMIEERAAFTAYVAPHVQRAAALRAREIDAALVAAAT